MKQIQFRLTAYTDAAGKRNDIPPLFGNEDNFFVDSDLSNDQQGEFSTDEIKSLSDYGSLLVVADGMGGMNAGEIASDIAIQTVKHFFAYERLSHDIVSTAEKRVGYMERVVAEADTAIKVHARSNKECEGMGSTIILVWICDGMASVTWCGDSRAYLYRESEGIKQISKDHSYVQSLVDDGKITEDEAFDHPYGNIITRSLGDPEKKAQAESRTIPIYKGDIILVCSDGLSGVLRDRSSHKSEDNPHTEDTLEDIIRANRLSMQQCRKALWNAAERAAWYDNVTAILYEITDGETVPAQHADTNGQLPIKTNGYINIRINKKKASFVIGILIIIACLCVVIYHKKNISEWNERYDNVQKLAKRYNLNYILGRLDSLEIGNIKGLHELDSIMTVRIDLLEQDVINAAPNADSLRNIICNSPDIDMLDLYPAIEEENEPKVADPMEKPMGTQILKSRNEPRAGNKDNHATKCTPHQESLSSGTITPAIEQNKATDRTLGIDNNTSEDLTEEPNIASDLQNH